MLYLSIQFNFLIFNIILYSFYLILIYNIANYKIYIIVHYIMILYTNIFISTPIGVRYRVPERNTLICLFIIVL